MRIEFVEVDNGSVTVYKVLQKGRESVKVYERFIKDKGYRVKV
jgi:hypothetical protein